MSTKWREKGQQIIKKYDDLKLTYEEQTKTYDNRNLPRKTSQTLSLSKTHLGK